MLDTPITDGSFIPTRFSSPRNTFLLSTGGSHALPHNRSAPFSFIAVMASSTSLEKSYFSDGGALRSASAAFSSLLNDLSVAVEAEALQASLLYLSVL